MGALMTSEWRVIQLFLPPQDGELHIYEVEMETTTRRVRCNCHAYQAKSTCKHERIVKTRMKQNGGQYPLNLHVNASTHDSSELFKDRQKFREFIIRYGQVEVL